MATVTGLTAARMLAIEANSVISGTIVGDNLILTKFNATTVNAGNVRGPTGATGPTATLAGTYAARPAASAPLNGQIYFATDKMMSWECIAAAWVLIAVFAPEVTSLPTSPIDQQECIFVANATNGIKWHLRYRSASASAYKWEPVNGATPLTATVDTSEAVVSATFTNATTLGPDVILPLAGDWEVDFEAQTQSNAAGVVAPSIGINVAGVTPTGTLLVAGTLNAVNHQLPLNKSRLITGRAASDLIRLQYLSAPSQSMLFNARRLRVRPVRVG